MSCAWRRNDYTYFQALDTSPARLQNTRPGELESAAIVG